MNATEMIVSKALNQELNKLWRIQVKRPGGSGGRISSALDVIDSKLALRVVEHHLADCSLLPFFKLNATVIKIHNEGSDNTDGQVGDHDHREYRDSASSLVDDGPAHKEDVQVADSDG